VLRDHGIAISMDGRGRCHDNIFVERLWWTVKHEWVYLRPAANGIEQKRSLRLPKTVKKGILAPKSPGIG
jgi:putative transposase